MKLFNKQIVIICIICVWFSSFINAMKEIDEARRLRCQIAALAKVDVSWINIPNSKEITSLEFTHSKDVPLIIKATYIKNNTQTEEGEPQTEITVTWNCSTRKQLSLNAIQIQTLSHELLRPGLHHGKDDEVEDNDFKIYNPAYPDQQFIGRRRKDKTWRLYMAEPFTPLCYLARKKRENPHIATFSPDGNYIITAHPQKILIWNITKKNNMMETLQHPKKWQSLVLQKCLQNEPIGQNDKKWLKDQFNFDVEQNPNPRKQDAKRQGWQ